MNYEEKLTTGMSIGLVIFLFLFFGRIIMNSIEHTEYINNFKIECKEKGGVVFIPKGVRGWPKAECRDPRMMINIDGG